MARQRLGSIGVAVIVGNHVTDPWLKPAGVLAHPVDGIGPIVARFPQWGGRTGNAQQIPDSQCLQQCSFHHQ